MARVNRTEVKCLVPSNMDDDAIDALIIEQATTIVDENLLSEGFSDTKLKFIELNLAAHFLALATEGGALTETQVGEARDRFADVYSAGFKSTRFGQTAVALDTSGVLNNIGSAQLQAQFRVV